MNHPNPKGTKLALNKGNKPMLKDGKPVFRRLTTAEKKMIKERYDFDPPRRSSS